MLKFFEYAAVDAGRIPDHIFASIPTLKGCSIPCQNPSNQRPMIALRVTHNGEPLCVAGAEDLSVLHTIVGASGPLGPKTVPMREGETIDFRLHIGGLTHRGNGFDDDHLRWNLDVPLKLGDRIEVQFIETDHPDSPVEVRPHDIARHEARQREQFLEAKETYCRLRFEIRIASRRRTHFSRNGIP